LDKAGVYPIEPSLSSFRAAWVQLPVTESASLMLEGFPLISRFTIPFGDVDMFQHVNNVAYVRWCETIRMEYFARTVGEIRLESAMIQANLIFTYERELRYRERIAIGVRNSRIGTKSLDLSYEIWSVDAERRAAHGSTTVVAYDFVERKTIVVPDAWREAIAAFDAGPQQNFQ
jgi:acyl-CoA thioester hydrolase